MMRGNAEFINKGGIDATVTDIPYVQVDAPPPVDPAAQRRFEDCLFERFIDGKEPEEEPEVVPPGLPHVQLVRGAVLKKIDAQDLAANTKAAYFFGRVNYRDWKGARSVEFCRYYYKGRIQKFQASTRS